MRRQRVLVLGVVLFAGTAAVPRLPAQQSSRSRVGVARAGAGTPELPGTGLPRAPGVERTGAIGVARWGRMEPADRRRWAPVASLLLPGTGQTLLGQDRFVAYLAMEAWSVLEFANQRTEARRQQNRYRNLARDVARSLFGTKPPVGTWAYYESMEHYVESGVFDRLPGGEVDPDEDVSTYNGAMWLLARQTYWTDPTVPPLVSSTAYRNAYNFYLDRAVRPQYRWSWRNAQLEQDIYVRTIQRSNTSYRGARRALGLVIANHLLSSVDAFATLRVEGLEGGNGRGFAVRGSLPLR